MLALGYIGVLLWALPAAALSSHQSLASAAPELAAAPAATRVAFVEAAVAELASAQRALQSSAGAHNANPHDRKLAGWSKGAQAYISGLHSAAAAARAGAAVRLVVDRGNLLRVVIGQHPARQFIVAAPQAKGRAALERAILRRLCAAGGCDGSDLTTGKGEPARVAAAATAPTAGAPATAVLSHPPAPRLLSTLPSGDGLSCASDEVRHHVLYDHACGALLTDVRALVKALHAAARRGVAIDWSLPARPIAKGDNYELAVNDHGDAVSLAMPALGQSPELLVEILPWAHARLFGSFQTLALRPPARLVYSAAVAQR